MAAIDEHFCRTAGILYGKQKEVYDTCKSLNIPTLAYYRSEAGVAKLVDDYIEETAMERLFAIEFVNTLLTRFRDLLDDYDASQRKL